jgi:hypothetical protein
VDMLATAELHTVVALPHDQQHNTTIPLQRLLIITTQVGQQNLIAALRIIILNLPVETQVLPEDQGDLKIMETPVQVEEKATDLQMAQNIEVTIIIVETIDLIVPVDGTMAIIENPIATDPAIGMATEEPVLARTVLVTAGPATVARIAAARTVLATAGLATAVRTVLVRIAPVTTGVATALALVTDPVDFHLLVCAAATAVVSKVPAQLAALATTGVAVLARIVPVRTVQVAGMVAVLVTIVLVAGMTTALVTGMEIVLVKTAPVGIVQVRAGATIVLVGTDVTQAEAGAMDGEITDQTGEAMAGKTDLVGSILTVQVHGEMAVAGTVDLTGDHMEILGITPDTTVTDHGVMLLTEVVLGLPLQCWDLFQSILHGLAKAGKETIHGSQTHVPFTTPGITATMAAITNLRGLVCHQSRFLQSQLASQLASFHSQTAKLARQHSHPSFQLQHHTLTPSLNHRMMLSLPSMSIPTTVRHRPIGVQLRQSMKSSCTRRRRLLISSARLHAVKHFFHLEPFFLTNSIGLI